MKKERLAVTTSDAPLAPGTLKLKEPVYGRYQVAFAGGGLNQLASAGKLLKYWDIACDPSGNVSKDITARFLNGYVPIYRDEDRHDDRFLAGRRSDRKKEELIDQLVLGDPKSFNHLASKALIPREDGDGFTGVEALGVLKADVDQLGMLMACGIKEEHASLSRLATLSRQLHWYFAVYLPHLLATDERFQDVYTVFAGGDDLFLIGPWNRMIELAVVLREFFEQYTCGNPEVHFSAGITLHKPHTPLSRLAEESERALKQAKDKDEGRNRITLFGETAKWDEFLDLMEVKKTLLQWKEGGLVNNAMLYRLNEFILMAEAEQRVLRRKHIGIHDMECLKWHALFHYTAERNVGKGLQKEEKQRALEEFSRCMVWLKTYGARLRMALWDVLYNQRRSG